MTSSTRIATMKVQHHPVQEEGTRMPLSRVFQLGETEGTLPAISGAGRCKPFARHLLFLPDLHSHCTNVYKTKSLMELIPTKLQEVTTAVVKCRCLPHRCQGKCHRCQTPEIPLAQCNRFRQLTVPSPNKWKVYRDMSTMMDLVVSDVFFFSIAIEQKYLIEEKSNALRLFSRGHLTRITEFRAALAAIFNLGKCRSRLITFGTQQIRHPGTSYRT